MALARVAGLRGPVARRSHHLGLAISFIFLFFNFVFYKNIFLFLKFTEIYPGRRAKAFRKKFALGPLKDRQVPAAWQRDGRDIFL